MNMPCRIFLLWCGFLLALAPLVAGQPPDETRRKALELAAAEGSPAAQYALGAGAEAAAQFSDAISWYRQAANQGYAAAQFKLAELLETGQGIKPDAAQALEWYRKAGAQGFSSAIARLKVLDPSFVPPRSKKQPAQTIVHSFADLTQTLKPGTPVRAIDARGHEVDGVVAGLSASSLALTLADGRQQDFSELSVNEIEVRRHFALRGLAIGGAAGLGFGWYIYSLGHDCGRCAPGPGWSLAVGGALGAAIGAGVGAEIVGGRTVYLSFPGGTRRSWTIAPLASARMRAFVVSARF